MLFLSVYQATNIKDLISAISVLLLPLITSIHISVLHFATYFDDNLNTSQHFTMLKIQLLLFSFLQPRKIRLFKECQDSS